MQSRHAFVRFVTNPACPTRHSACRKRRPACPKSSPAFRPPNPACPIFHSAVRTNHPARPKPFPTHRIPRPAPQIPPPPRPANPPSSPLSRTRGDKNLSRLGRGPARHRRPKAPTPALPSSSLSSTLRLRPEGSLRAEGRIRERERKKSPYAARVSTSPELGRLVFCDVDDRRKHLIGRRIYDHDAK